MNIEYKYNLCHGSTEYRWFCMPLILIKPSLILEHCIGRGYGTDCLDGSNSAIAISIADFKTNWEFFAITKAFSTFLRIQNESMAGALKQSGNIIWTGYGSGTQGILKT